MPARTSARSSHRPCWSDRFRTPTADDLLREYTKPVAAAVAVAREHLCTLAGIKEEIRWLGIPWRWTFVYRTEHESVGRATAYLIPEPAKPTIAVPMSAESLENLPARKFSRAVRDVLLHAPEVAGVRWPLWELQSKSQLEEIVRLVELKGQKVHAAV